MTRHSGTDLVRIFLHGIMRTAPDGAGEERMIRGTKTRLRALERDGLSRGGSHF